MTLKIDGNIPGFGNYYHFQACPKYRTNVFNAQIASRLKNLLISKSSELGWLVEGVAVDSDHVHFLIKSEATPSQIAQRLFGYVSKVLREEFQDLKELNADALWGGRQCTTVKNSDHLKNVRSYINKHEQV